MLPHFLSHLYLLEFGFCPCHCLQSHGQLLIIQHRACSSRSSPQAISLLLSVNGHSLFLGALASFSHSPHRPTQMLSSPQCGPRGLWSSEFRNWWRCLFLCPLLDDLIHTFPQSPGYELMTMTTCRCLQLPGWHVHVLQSCKRYPKQNLDPQFSLNKCIQMLLNLQLGYISINPSLKAENIVSRKCTCYT